MAKTITVKQFQKAFLDRLGNNPPIDRTIYREQGSRLLLVAHPGGQLSWVFRYTRTVKGKKKGKKIVLGHFPSMTLAEARKQAASNYEQILSGCDPKDEVHRSSVQRLDVRELIEDHYAPHITERLENRPSGKGELASLRKNLSDNFLDLAVANVTSRDIRTQRDAYYERLQDRAKMSGREFRGTQVNRLLQYLRNLFGYAADEDSGLGIIAVNPAAGVKRRVNESHHARDRVLDPHREMFIAYTALDECPMSFPIYCAEKLKHLLGGRNKEFMQMRWADVDLKTQVWTHPGFEKASYSDHDADRKPFSTIVRTKNRLPQTRWIASLSIGILKELQAHYENERIDSPWVFPNRANLNAHMDLTACAKALHRSQVVIGLKPFTGHDKRRTVTSVLSMQGVDDTTKQKVLSHAPRGVTAVHYDKWAYWPEKVKAWETINKLFVDWLTAYQFQTRQWSDSEVNALKQLIANGTDQRKLVNDASIHFNRSPDAIERMLRRLEVRKTVRETQAKTRTALLVGAPLRPCNKCAAPTPNRLYCSRTCSARASAFSRRKNAVTV